LWCFISASRDSPLLDLVKGLSGGLQSHHDFGEVHWYLRSGKMPLFIHQVNALKGQPSKVGVFVYSREADLGAPLVDLIEQFFCHVFCWLRRDLLGPNGCEFGSLVSGLPWSRTNSCGADQTEEGKGHQEPTMKSQLVHLAFVVRTQHVTPKGEGCPFMIGGVFKQWNFTALLRKVDGQQPTS